MRVRRTKPYVCVDCGFDDHIRFLKTRDLDAAAGAWLRCLAHSRAQELDGVVPAVWLRRTFAGTFDRIEELVAVGLLRRREDGDFEIHAYAPRNQTRASLEEARSSARERMAVTRSSWHGSPEQAANSGHRVAARSDRTSALVPTSTSLSSSSSRSLSSSSSLVASPEDASGIVKGGGGGRAAPTASSTRDALPPSERAMSGPFWLGAFTDGITDHTHRPCTVGRVYLGTLERLVTHHAPGRDATSACGWLREEARAFAAQWEGKHPAKGLTPDGLELWLNAGRQGPPEFGRPRIVQPSAEAWHEDDWSDLGAEVLR